MLKSIITYFKIASLNSLAKSYRQHQDGLIKYEIVLFIYAPVK